MQDMQDMQGSYKHTDFSLYSLGQYVNMGVCAEWLHYLHSCIQQLTACNSNVGHRFYCVRMQYRSVCRMTSSQCRQAKGAE